MVADGIAATIFTATAPGPDTQWFSFQLLVFEIVFVTLLSVLWLICVIYWCVCYVRDCGNYCHHKWNLICCDVKLCVALLCFNTLENKLFLFFFFFLVLNLKQWASTRPHINAVFPCWGLYAVSCFFNKQHFNNLTAVTVVEWCLDKGLSAGGSKWSLF